MHVMHKSSVQNHDMHSTPRPIPRPPHNPSQHISMRSPPPACLPALALALASLLSAPAGCACASVSFVSAMKRIPPPAIGPTAAAAFAGSSSPGHGLRARRATVRLSLGISAGGDAPKARVPVRLVTFDLDNTLWRTAEVISAANDALAAHVEEVAGSADADEDATDGGTHAVPRSETVMGQLFRGDPQRYCCPLPAPGTREGAGGAADGGGGDGGGGSADDAGGDGNLAGVHISASSTSGGGTPLRPVQLTRLRVDALRQIFSRHGRREETDAEEAALRAFDVWAAARHAAVPLHYAGAGTGGVVPVLERIRRIGGGEGVQGSRGRDDGPPVVLGAITDGNSDPRLVDGLAPYFDFVVNSESVGVAKPDQRVYLAAAEVASRHPNLRDLLGRASDGDFDLGPWWVHVGDDLVKDVAAADILGLRTIWTTELLRPAAADDDGGKIVADAVIDEFAAVADVLHSWHNDSAQTE